MAPFLQTVKSFADVPTEQGVDTLAFLDAAGGVVALFKLLDKPAFGLVVSDLERNIAKVRTRFLAHPAQSTTLEQLVLYEKSEKKNVATEGLLWLLRGLSFTHEALRAAQRDPSIELANAFTQGYKASLSKHHNFVTGGLFSLAMKTCPSRSDFYAKLADTDGGAASVTGDQVTEELDKWLAGLDRIVKQLQRVYEEKGYGDI